MPRDKNTIINQMVSQVADVLEHKIANLRLTAEILTESGKHEQAATWLTDVPEIEAAMNLLRRREGSWA